MDSLTPKISHGDKSHMKLKKSKCKSADYVSYCDRSIDNISVDSELHEVAEEKGKMKKIKIKKHKNKEGSDVTELSEVVQSDKKRKLDKDTCSSGEMGRVGLNVDVDSIAPKKKKKLMEETKSFVKIGEECKGGHNISEVGKRKSLNVNLSTASDSPLSCHTEKMLEVLENYEVGEENYDICGQNKVENPTVRELCEPTKKKKKKKKGSNLSIQEECLKGECCMNDHTECVDTSRQNLFENTTVRELYEEAGKKKKKKESNLCTEKEGCSGEQFLKDNLGVSAPVLKKDKAKEVTCQLAVSEFFNSTLYYSTKAEIKSNDEAPSFKKKKKKAGKESPFMQTGCNSTKVKEEPIENVLPPPKKKRKHKSTFCVEEEVDKRLSNKKSKPFQEDIFLETKNNLQLQPRISSAEGNDFDKVVLDGCSKKERKKKLRGEVLDSRTCEASHDSNSMYQENIVEKLWDEIKQKIEHKIQDGRKNEKEETASHQPEEVQPENNSDEVEEVCYSMVFKFDNNPNVRHYVPRRLIALNGLRMELKEMKQIDLQIPRTSFKGSSLDKIPGYGYNT